MWIYMCFYSIMMTLFLQNHLAISSSYDENATHLSPKMQKLALFQFKLSFTINSSTAEFCEDAPSVSKTMNWSMSSDCCTWDGVTCDHMTGNVIGLDLRCSHLEGSIRPDSTLFNLSFLQNIIFDSNSLHGELPLEIFHLPNLEVLSLEFNSQLIVKLPKHKWGSSSNLQLLALTQTTLSGGIPDSIGYLKSLTFLSIFQCNLSGPIPRSISNLTQLTYLNLGFNLLSGQIPDSLANIQNLGILYLNNNNFSGPIPRSIGNLTQLLLLDLDSNYLTGQIPRSVGNLTQLTLLQLSSNYLTDRIPDSLASLQNLQLLSLGRNNLIGPSPSWISNCRELSFLDLSENSLTGPLPSNLILPNLTFLDLSHNSLNGTIPSWFFHSPLLTYISIDHNEFTGQVYVFGSLEMYSLKYLSLSHNNLTGGLEHLPWKILTYLDLQSNMLQGSLPASICNSSSLDILNLSHNNLTGVLPSCTRGLNYSLSVFDLRMNSIEGSLPSALVNFRKLRSLNLHGNKLEGTIPLSFSKFDYLEVFDVGNNQINDTFPLWLETLQNLQVLILKSNKFFGIITNVSKIEHPFPSLRIIDLSNNEFSGPLPAKYIQNFKGMMNKDANKMERTYMGNSLYSDTMMLVVKGVEIEFIRILTIFTAIDLSRNKFEGEIPEYIGNLESLRYLNLSHNNLTGHIPSLVGKLLMLESLDLSFNLLVGVIPQELTSIYSLSHLNLSQNDLTGHIPRGPQFSTFENSSYAGNFGLCGPPLSRRCIRETQQEEFEDDEDDGFFFSGFTWESVAIGYGCGVVVGFVVGYVMFMAGKPKWFTGIIARELGLKIRRLEISVGYQPNMNRILI
ncbi:hypothetical protein DCAR_0415214 [Daucus carota subsp. sativus]|uniref:Leucine-rich repeat-containing N-terminal plant-type domain-containing protein n=1 Tax=Daucus carota subsp. sativus TaxID=79200 RepID=A0AAF0WTR1_DAUCS|nr:PREDICTED: receptor-like protein 12 [Daucus carota subsp. sativus]WOG95885.1 hypothetical protein DCAR_0415214 [Daucus carota subsp. sativus]